MVVKLGKTFMKYVYLEGSVDELVKILNHIRNEKGWVSDDVDDTLRILNNFDVFYEMARKKFKDYISPRKKESDLIRGRVLVDKIKLVKNGERKATIIFDKRVKEDMLIEVMNELGISYERI